MQFASDLECVLSWYASICMANLVLLGEKTTEPQTHIKSYLVLDVIYTHTPHFLGLQGLDLFG